MGFLAKSLRIPTGQVPFRIFWGFCKTASSPRTQAVLPDVFGFAPLVAKHMSVAQRQVPKRPPLIGTKTKIRVTCNPSPSIFEPRPHYCTPSFLRGPKQGTLKVSHTCTLVLQVSTRKPKSKPGCWALAHSHKLDYTRRRGKGLEILTPPIGRMRIFIYTHCTYTYQQVRCITRPGRTRETSPSILSPVPPVWLGGSRITGGCAWPHEMPQEILQNHTTHKALINCGALYSCPSQVHAQPFRHSFLKHQHPVFHGHPAGPKPLLSAAMTRSAWSVVSALFGRKRDLTTYHPSKAING